MSIIFLFPELEFNTKLHSGKKRRGRSFLCQKKGLVRLHRLTTRFLLPCFEFESIRTSRLPENDAFVEPG